MCRSFWLFLAFFARASADVCSFIHYSATEWDVNCSDRNLTVLPDYKDRPVVSLNLRNSNLTSNFTLKGWDRLKYVDLSFNRLEDFKSNILDGFKELGSLNASYCSLRNISSSQLKGETLIQLLDLSGNDRLPSSADFLPTLNKSLERGTFTLHINNMGISNFPQNIFISAVSLHRLHMKDNLLQLLPIFPKNLVYLDVSNNSLVVLRSDPFKICTNLKSLFVQNNHLAVINDEVFAYLPNLTVLSLSGNKQLEYLPNGVFYHNHNLKELHLAYCNFKTLSPYFETTFLSLNHLELRGNPWECNPSIEWFLSLNTSSVALSNIRCEDGLAFNQHFGHLKQTLSRNIVIVLVVMTFSFFGIGAFYIYDLEKKRKSLNPYWRLGRKNVLSDPVYITTVA